MSRDEKSIKDIISNLSKKSGWKPAFNRAKVEALAKELLGKVAMERMSMVIFRDGKLFLKCESASLKQELYYAKETILKNLNKELGERIVEDVVFL